MAMYFSLLAKISAAALFRRSSSPLAQLSLQNQRFHGEPHPLWTSTKN